MDKQSRISGYLHRTWRSGLILLVISLALTGLVYAAGNPGFLGESIDDVAAGDKSYRIWYTTDCDGDANCECDAVADLDTDDPPDGVLDTDSPNDCIATVDSDTDGIFDTGPDHDTDNILNVMDINWFGGAGAVESVPRNVQRTVNRYVNDWSLKNPYWDRDENRNIYVFDIDYLGLAYGNGSGEELDTGWMLTGGPEPRGTVLHELWHNTQYAYDVSAGAWLMEGQARMLQDKVFDDLDNRVGSRYHNSVNAYLGNTTYVNWEDRDDDGTDEFAQADGLLGASYNASPWWTYIADQAGTEFAGTAGEGMDVLIAVLEQADDHGRQGVSGVDRVLRDRIGQGFTDTFWDFTVANYAKDFDLSELDHSYLSGRDPEKVLAYSDEKRTPPDELVYGPVERQTFNEGDLYGGPSGGVDAFDSEVNNPDAMSAYGANYYEGLLGPDCLLAYWRVEGDPGARFLHSWLIVQEDSNGDTREEVVVHLRSEGQNFARALWNLRKSSNLGAPDYTRMVGIVATGNEAYGYDWELGCTQPSLNIVDPTQEDPAYVGDPNDPGRFLVWLEVTGGAGSSTYVAGLDWSRDFTVTVGTDVADVLNGGYVQDQYWLVVEAPDKPAASIGDKFDLLVNLGPSIVTDMENDAVIYDIHSSDQVLVIDRSGSMGDFNKLPSAKTAARLFTDVIQKFDMLGVVSFSDDATEEFPLTIVPDQDDSGGVRAAAQAQINGLSPTNRTSIGDGLDKGQSMLAAGGDPDHEWFMVLLSDGIQNEPLYWNDVRSSIVASGTQVLAIALGQDADEELMREIAQDTCGPTWRDHCYQYIEESGVLLAGESSRPQTLNAAAAVGLPNALADTYRRFRETIAGHQRLWQDSGTVNTATTFDVELNEDGARDAFFSFNWNDAANPLDVTITPPPGVTFVELADGQTHRTFYADRLPPGTYRIQLTATGGASTWVGSLSGRLVGGTELHAFIDNHTHSLYSNNERWPGLPVFVQASLTDDFGPVAGATISATVLRPDGEIDRVTLVDDGGVYDDIANDGVYGYTYDRVNRPLSYDPLEAQSWTIDLHATGTNNDGKAFERYARLTYVPTLGREKIPLDNDADGMLDRWEDRFAGVDSTIADSDQDPDGDGLTNKDEFELGTHPDDPDTDRGGETDGSEVQNGRNPLLTADDLMPPLTDVWVENHPGEVILHFNPYPQYQSMRVYRRTGAAGSFTLVKTVPVSTTLLSGNAPAHEPVFDPKKGQILDDGLTNDQDYFYYLQPVGASDVTGRPGPILYAEPAADPYQPEGVVLINDDAELTHSKNVTLTFLALTKADGSRDVHAVQISNSPDLSGTTWLPYKPAINWTLNPDPQTDYATVYVRFRDGAGNVSDVIYADSIRYDPPNFVLPDLWIFPWVILDLRPLLNYTFIYTPLNYIDLDLFYPLPGLMSTAQTTDTLLYYGGVGFELMAYDAVSQPITELPEFYTITVSYEDWMWRSGGIGSEDVLNIYRDDGSGWTPLLPCEGCTHDPEANTITARLDRSGKFALLGTGVEMRYVYLPMVMRTP